MTTSAAPPKQWEGTVLDAVVAYYEANQAALLALAATYNGTLEQLAESGLNTVLSKEPILKMILGAEASALPSQLDPFLVKEEGYVANAILAYLKGLAAKYGG